MVSLNPLRFEKALLLAPMEAVTDLAYRFICKEMGAEVVYTEFVNSDGLVRGCKRGKKKMEITEEERPVGIQIYGNDVDAMVGASVMAAELKPDIIDINAGCWVKKVSRRGAGAGLLKDPCFMQKMIGDVVKAVSTLAPPASPPIPVTVKTRIGWCEDTINIVEVAKRLEDVGVQALTLHCRTKAQGHSGDPQWEWIEKVKKEVSIPVILNGGIMTAQDVLKAFSKTPADGVMIARGAIGRPWIFQEARELLDKNGGRTNFSEADFSGDDFSPTNFSLEKRVDLCLRHLRRSIDLMGENRAIPAFRKYYSGYLGGFHNSSKLRVQLMKCNNYQEVSAQLSSFSQDDFNKKGEDVSCLTA